jgi:hypothetical protein
MHVTFLQSSDPIFYFPILAETSKTVRKYCLEHGFRYEQYVGVKRGRMPWQATYNRIYMLKEMLDRGIDGWVLYLDADCLVVDSAHDLRAYLRERQQYAGIFAGHLDGVPHNINAGGFAINFSHPVGRALVYDYWLSAQAIGDDTFNAAVEWGNDMPEDQLMLFRLLQDYCEKRGVGQHFLFEPYSNSYVNNGPFVAQYLRSNHETFDQRVAAIRNHVARVLGSGRPALDGAAPGTYLSATHPAVHTMCGSKQASAIISDERGGTLVFGPYIKLSAGRYVARIYGEAAGGPGVRPIRSDVVSNFGTSTWSTQSVLHAKGVSGTLAEHRFELTDSVDGIELRLFVEERQNIVVHALHFLKQ